MALLTVQEIVQAAITPTYAAAAASDTFTDDGQERTFLHYKNTGTQKSLTVVPAAATTNVLGVGPVTVPTITVTIPATTGDKMVGPFPSAYISSAGIVTAALDSATGVTVAAVKMKKAVT